MFVKVSFVLLSFSDHLTEGVSYIFKQRMIQFNLLRWNDVPRREYVAVFPEF